MMLMMLELLQMQMIMRISFANVAEWFLLAIPAVILILLMQQGRTRNNPKNI